MSERLEKFACKYFTICDALGKSMNGIDRARFVKMLEDSGAEAILEMCDTIREYDKIKGIKDE
jgi:hypothetical protein